MESTTEPIDGTTAIGEARRRAVTRLASVSGAEADLDARIFVEEATRLDRFALLAERDRPIGSAAAGRLQAMLDRRMAGEPVWRIVGVREFWGLSFEVTPAVLDPRPDTETIVAAALAATRASRPDVFRILDLGVGSGAILAALLHERPHALGWGVDRSEAACRVARNNFAALGLDTRALVVNGDWATALPPSRFDLVVSNPPYIETAAIGRLAPEVRNFDPHAALDGGLDGLACYRLIAADLPRLLAPNGVSVLEVGADQAGDVRALLTAAGLRILEVRRDLGGHERAVVASMR